METFRYLEHNTDVCTGRLKKKSFLFYKTSHYVNSRTKGYIKRTKKIYLISVYFISHKLIIRYFNTFLHIVNKRRTIFNLRIFSYIIYRGIHESGLGDVVSIVCYTLTLSIYLFMNSHVISCLCYM